MTYVLRESRLVALKAASVKRFNEKHAVLQAIKMKEEEIRQKAEEEERERAAQQQQRQQQAEKQQQQQHAESAAAKEKEERDRKEKEDKARKEREEREQKEKEKGKQLLQPAKSPRVVRIRFSGRSKPPGPVFADLVAVVYRWTHQRGRFRCWMR